MSPAAALAIYFVLLPSPAATAIAAGDYSFIVASYVAVVVIIILYFCVVASCSFQQLVEIFVQLLFFLSKIL